MKKLVSLLLMVAVVMSFTTIAITSVSAEENEDLVAAAANENVEEAAASDDAVSVGAGTDVSDSGTSGKVYFVKPDKWVGTIVYCHIFEATGDQTSFYGWQTKKEKCTEEGGKFVYDLSILDNSAAQISGGLKSGSDYNIMFSDNSGNESCAIMFNTHCIGDTAKIVSDERTFENAVDSTKKSWELSWTNNADKYGVPLQITSVGTIQGKFISSDNTIDKIIATWDKDYPSYPNAQSFSPQSSARDHKTRLAELKTEMHKMAADGKVYLVGGGVYSESSSSNGGSSNGGSSNGGSSNNGSSDGSNGGSVSGSDGSSSGSSDGGSSLTTKDGKKVTKDANGNYVDENGNVVDASDVVETTGSVSTGESTTYIFVTLGVMLLAAGVYFVTRKRKA